MLVLGAPTSIPEDVVRDYRSRFNVYNPWTSLSPLILECIRKVLEVCGDLDGLDTIFVLHAPETSPTVNGIREPSEIEASMKTKVYQLNIMLGLLVVDVPEGCVIIREHAPISNLFTCLWFN